MSFPVGAGSRRGPADSIIVKRRQQEDQISWYATTVNQMKQMGNRANWEEKGTQDNARRQVQSVVRHLTNQQQAELNDRRQQLAALYNQEWQQWQEELQNSAETIEQRKQRMMQRAQEIRAKREEERLKLVTEKRFQQQRESTDSVRTLDSRRILKKTFDGVAVQQKEREEKLKVDKEEEYRLAMMELATVEARSKREELEKKQRADAMHDVQNVLQQQVDLVNRRRSYEKQIQKTDDIEQLQRWESYNKMAKDIEVDERQQAIQRNREMMLFNHIRSSRKEIEKQKEDAFELALLNKALEEEEASRKREADEKERRKRDAVQFRKYLEKQMEKEKNDETATEMMRKQYEDAYQASQEAQLKAERDARNALRDAVLQTVDEQNRLLGNQRLAEKVDDLMQAELIKEKVEQMSRKEKQEEEMRKKAAKDQQFTLKKQMDIKNTIRQQEKQSDFLQLKQMQMAEKEQQQQLRIVEQSEVAADYKRKRNAWSYDV